MKTSLMPSGLISLLSLQVCSVAAAPAPVHFPALVPTRVSSLLMPRGKLWAFDAEVSKAPLMYQDFPDPSIVQDTDGTWYAFATTDGSINVQVAKSSSPSGPWTYLSNADPLPDTGAWTDGSTNTWAPDVRIIAPGQYVMYYSGELSNDSSTHCVGTATASSITGPYTPTDTPFVCPVSQGGAIDPAGFYDNSTGRRYVVYKIDGNSIGHGGSCDNGVAPYVPTPIMLQEVSADDGINPLSDATELLDRTQEEDGPLVEAPDLVRLDDGTYILFYSSHCWSSPEYNVNYAIADSVAGPYKRSRTPLIATGDFNTTSPGGATSIAGGGAIVFHANCDAGRCMFGAKFAVQGSNVIVS